MGLLFNIPDFIWAIVNLFVLYLVLRKVLFKPVTEFMEKRANSIKQQLEDSKKAGEEANQLKANYEKMLGNAKEDAEKIILDAKAKAQEEYDNIIRQAKAEVEMMKEKAKEELELERKEMLKDIRNEVVNLALEAASKVVEANMDTELNRKLVNDVVSEKNIA